MRAIGKHDPRRTAHRRNDDRPQANAGLGRSGRSRQRPLLLHGKEEEELRSFPGDAHDADLAAHRLDEPLADREPEPGAAEAARRRLVSLREGGEDRSDLVGRDADAGVADPHANPARFARRHVDDDQHMAALGEFERVVEASRLWPERAITSA